MTKHGQRDGLGDGSTPLGLTSLLASSTLGTMCGRQRPSISMTLASLSAIRDTWKTTGLVRAAPEGCCARGASRPQLGPCHFCFKHTFNRTIYEEEENKNNNNLRFQTGQTFLQTRRGFKTLGRSKGADREAYQASVLGTNSDNTRLGQPQWLLIFVLGGKVPTKSRSLVKAKEKLV